MKFTINKPSVWMYKTDDIVGEVSDELLFGTVIEIISETDTCVYCRPDYGYSGYINKWELCECETEDCDDGEKQFIYKRCDVLSAPEYKLVPVMSLSQGSKIKILGEHDERFAVCLIGKREFYVPRYALKCNLCGELGKDMADIAGSYLGTPYRWGGKSNFGSDCSGLAFMCARLCGKSLYRDAVPDERYINIIEEEEAGSGDLIYFRGHVAIATEKGKIIHASARAGSVVLQDFPGNGLSYSDVLCYARIK